MVSFPWLLKLVVCPVYGCPVRVINPGRLREHFMYRHWKSKVAILQELPVPLSQCNNYGIHMPALRMMKNRRTDRCEKSMEMWLRRRGVEMAERCR